MFLRNFGSSHDSQEFLSQRESGLWDNLGGQSRWRFAIFSSFKVNQSAGVTAD